MPTILSEVPLQAVQPIPPRKQWTRSDCTVLESSGLLDQQRFELINGELIDKMGKKRPHVNSHILLLAWILEVFGKQFVNSEGAIDVAPEDNPTSEPEPDIIVLNKNLSHFRSTNPKPGDLALVIEVSDATLLFDLGAKASLYARAGIQDYWVLDIAGRRLIVHRAPSAGRYGSIAVYSENESVAPLAAPGSQFHVADAFADTSDGRQL